MTRLARAVAAVVAASSVALPSAASGRDGEGATGGSWSAGLAVTRAEPGITATGAALRRPRGTYTGRRGTLTLVVSGRSIQIAAFDYPCGNTTGRTSLQEIPIVRRRGRYRFSIAAHGITTYSDGRPDENAAIKLTGRFTPKALRAIGAFRVRTPYCGGTGPLEFTARR